MAADMRSNEVPQVLSHELKSWHDPAPVAVIFFGLIASTQCKTGDLVGHG
jgi:hypothetical protein